MGDVGINIKIMAKDQNIDLNKIVKKISSKFKVSDSRIEEIGFGLKALKVLIIKKDGTSGTDDIENFVGGLEEVESVEVENVSLI